VTEICMLLGFASLGSFSSRFTQLVGQSPTAYRDRWAARGQAHVPGCYLFMRGVLDLAGTAGSTEQSGRSPAGRGSPTVGA
jgi:Bacterial regulatory helix-turn-helix proteins, AraC family